MIKNIFYILTILGAGATAYFASVTKGKMTEAIDGTVERFDKNGIVSKNIETKDGEIEVAEGERETAESTRDETEANLENEAGKQNGLEKSLASLEAEIEEYDAELEQINGAQATAEAIIREMIPNAPAGKLSIDDVVGYIEGLENERKEKNLKLEEDTEIASKLETTVASDIARKESLQGRLSKVKNRIALNGVTASVSGVSNDYGFVVINRGGNNSNITESSKLLVSRGGVLIARLTVDQIEPTQTICNIVPSNLKKGRRVSNGDRVTLEVPVSN